MGIRDHAVPPAAGEPADHANYPLDQRNGTPATIAKGGSFDMHMANVARQVFGGG